MSVDILVLCAELKSQLIKEALYQKGKKYEEKENIDYVRLYGYRQPDYFVRFTLIFTHKLDGSTDRS